MILKERRVGYRQSRCSSLGGVGYVRLTQGKVAMIDPQFLSAVGRFGWCFSHGYALRGIGKYQGKRIYLHHFILDCAGLPRTNGHVDHINRDPLDNRLVNIRVTTRSANQANRDLQSNNTSGYRGVHRKRDKWSARIKRLGITRCLGSFATAQEAALAYDTAAIASDSIPNLNFPETP